MLLPYTMDGTHLLNSLDQLTIQLNFHYGNYFSKCKPEGFGFQSYFAHLSLQFNKFHKAEEIIPLTV